MQPALSFKILIELITYRLPFSKPFVTGSASFRHREGLLIRYSDDATEVLTEASPLPGFSSETLDQVISAAGNKKDAIDLFFTKSYSLRELKEFLKELPNLPSLQFALSFMGIQILSGRNRQSLYDLFDVDKPSDVRVNDVLPIQSLDETIRHFKKSYQNGFRTFKVKSSFPTDQLIRSLNALNQISGKDSVFRIDANRSWPADKSSGIIKELERFSIEYIEEPFTGTDLYSFTEFCKRSKIPIALDESIQNVSHLKELLNNLPEAVFIIKPTVLGNLFDLFETLSQLRTHFNRVIVTTALESSIGRKSVCSIASLIGDRTMAHGLNTGRFFKSDLMVDKQISDGRLELPTSGFYSAGIADLNNNYIQSVE